MQNVGRASRRNVLPAYSGTFQLFESLFNTGFYGLVNNVPSKSIFKLSGSFGFRGPKVTNVSLARNPKIQFPAIYNWCFSKPKQSLNKWSLACFNPIESLDGRSKFCKVSATGINLVHCLAQVSEINLSRLRFGSDP